MYAPGYITGSLPTQSGEHFQPGVYQAEIELGRSVLASVDLLVVP